MPAGRPRPSIAWVAGLVAIGLAIGFGAGWGLAPRDGEPAARGSLPEVEKGTLPSPDSGQKPSGAGVLRGPTEFEIVVERVLDGDTLEYRDEDGDAFKVRYLGIQAPERFTDYLGPESEQRNRALVLGQKVRLVFEKVRVDDMGRDLAYVYLGDSCVNRLLIDEGLAFLSPHPNTKTIEKYAEFVAASDAAKARGKGVWEEAASERWETAFRREDVYECSKKTVHRPGCPHVPGRPVRIPNLDEALEGRTACEHCYPTRNYTP